MGAWCGKMRLGGAPPPPSFSPSFSKSGLFFSKLFQRKLWPFCGISMGCKASKPKVSSSKYFAFSLGSKNPSHAARPMGIVEGTSKHASMDAVFRKKNRRLLFHGASAGRGVLRSGRRPMFRWQTTQTAVRSARDGGSIRWLAERPFARRTTSCATTAPAATVVRGRSPIARLIARLFSFPEAGECEAHVCRSAKSTVRFVYGDLRFTRASPLRSRDARA